MSVHEQQTLGLPVVQREALAAIMRGGPLTKRESTRLRHRTGYAQITFRGKPIANAVIRELAARARAAELPTFTRRPAPLAALSIGAAR